MDFDAGVTAAAPQYYGEAKMIRAPNLKERLDAAVKQAKERLAAVEEARTILERNPDMERLLDIMQRSHF